MIKLLTLKNSSDLSSDALYKICLTAEEYGLSDDNIETYESAEELLDAALIFAEKGYHIIISVENDCYNSLKRDVIGKLLLEEYESDEIKDLITVNAGDDISEIDLTGHCIIPRGSLYHFTADGLFCGFSVDALHGKLSFIPLDFMRLDAVLLSLKDEVLETMRAIENGERPPIRMPQTDIEPCVSELVTNLDNANMTLALATGEAAMWVYNLYESIDKLSEKIKFVEVVDEVPEDSADETAETESVKVIRHAREAMLNTQSTMGGAISEIYSTENAEGKTVYFAYAALVDRSSAKAKKINTSNPGDLQSILPHALTILAEMVNGKAEAAIKKAALKEEKEDAEESDDDLTQTDKNDKQLSKNMLIVACVALIVAVVLPIVLAVKIITPKETTTIPYQNPSIPVNGSLATDYYGTTTTLPYQSTSSFIPSTSQNISNNVSTTQPIASDVQGTTTQSVVTPSTKGTFTFYVFGYGHGVGMSQVGANYLAGLGWQWAEILTHYYYSPDASIVYGEIYPEKITYEGAQYDTREYLARATQAEIGSSYNIEAIKAQVVAIYTYARYYNSTSIASGNPIFTSNLTSSAHAFLGGDETPASTVYAAVDEIMSIGPYISYNGTTALTPFHSMSAGKTTSYYNTWGKEQGASLAYLAGARTSIGDYYDPEYKSTVTLSSEDIKTLAAAYGITLSGDPANWISIITHDAAVREDIGYVSSINVGGTVMTGNEFRIKLLGGRIRSHCFTFTYTPTA
ncbi:MAG: SpoIID/LytB domain-containing protein [Acutalibacteraceae bacterium]